jgi:hypothetical protein
MIEEKFENLQEMGGDSVIEEEFGFVFDLQRFDADDTQDDTADDTQDDTADDTQDDTADDTDADSDSDTDADSDSDSDSDADADTDSDSDDDPGKEEVKTHKFAEMTFEEILEELGFDSTSDNTYDITSEQAGKIVTMAQEGGLAVVSIEKGSVGIVLGKGEDTIVIQGNAPVALDFSKSTSADKIVLKYSSSSSSSSGDAAVEGAATAEQADTDKPVRTNVVLKGYKSSLGGGFVTGENTTAGIRSAIIGEGITFGSGEVVFNGSDGGKGTVTFDGNTTAVGSTTFNIYDKYGEEKQAVGFTHKEGGKLDVSAMEADDYVLVGNWDNKKFDGSTITGGKGDDTLLIGGGDVANAGGGDNLVRLNSSENRDGATVVLTEGRTRVTNLNNSFDEEEGDVVQVENFSETKLSYDENGINVKGDGFRATLDVEANENGVVTQTFKEGDNLIKAAIATEAGTTFDASEGANYFQGNNTDNNYSSVDFSNFDSEVNVDLKSTSTLGEETASFKDIKVFKAGENDAKISGSDTNETLIAGTGDATLYGAGGKNVMVGNADTTEREGRTTFAVLGTANNAQNTIQSFQFASDVEDNSLADVLEIDVTQNVVSNVFIKGENDVVMEVTSRSDETTERVLVEGAVGKNMYVTDTLVAQVNATELTYDGAASFFVATGKNAGIKVDNENVTKAVLWLGGKPDGNGGTYVGDIRTIDATGFDGDAELAGNDTNNTIYGGAGSNSLWGGNGGDDLLVGGSGQNMFFYTNGNGNDTIEGVNDGDVVYLSQVTFENIAGYNFENGQITINFNDGGKLTIEDNNKDVAVVVGDQTYYVNGDRSGFTTEK